MLPTETTRETSPTKARHAKKLSPTVLYFTNPQTHLPRKCSFRGSPSLRGGLFLPHQLRDLLQQHVDDLMPPTKDMQNKRANQWERGVAAMLRTKHFQRAHTAGGNQRRAWSRAFASLGNTPKIIKIYSSTSYSRKRAALLCPRRKILPFKPALDGGLGCGGRHIRPHTQIERAIL